MGKRKNQPVMEGGDGGLSDSESDLDSVSH